MHELTVTIARVLHNTFRSDGSIRKSWDEDVVTDQWLAVGSWQAAERVVAVLPMVVKP
jgi:hypothetical protein